MIDWAKRTNGSRLDLNVEAQTRSLLRTSAEGSHASRHARVRAGHGPSAAFDVSPLCGRSAYSAVMHSCGSCTADPIVSSDSVEKSAR